uniref:Uncharacterized protein n=1 Tax=Arundo donax TaxID=35708 RepID=A0A0A9G5B2_ARUDO
MLIKLHLVQQQRTSCGGGRAPASKQTPHSGQKHHTQSQESSG